MLAPVQVNSYAQQRAGPNMLNGLAGSSGLNSTLAQLRAIAEESFQFPEISAVRADGFRLPFADNAFDYAICSLITHHFTDAAVVAFLKELSRTARRAIFVIDLHREPVPYYLYRTVGRLFLHNRLIREDGALSILRSFQPEELERLARAAELKDIEVQQMFPARLVLCGRSSMRPAVASATQSTAQSLLARLRHGRNAMTRDEAYDVAIAGGGPAGTSAAIHLAERGMNVLLAEQKKFPRAKLCGEFISPECINHFARLGVAEGIFAAKGATLIETSFYSRRGNKVTVPSNWFGSDRAAIGLSRAEMDRLLLERAIQVGVTVLQEAQVVDPILEAHRVLGMRIRHNDEIKECRAQITIDATGRTRALARKLNGTTDRQRARLVAFKAHLQHARVAPGACEIYFYPGGYGGLSQHRRRSK